MAYYARALFFKQRFAVASMRVCNPDRTAAYEPGFNSGNVPFSYSMQSLQSLKPRVVASRRVMIHTWLRLEEPSSWPWLQRPWNEYGASWSQQVRVRAVMDDLGISDGAVCG